MTKATMQLITDLAQSVGIIALAIALWFHNKRPHR